MAARAGVSVGTVSNVLNRPDIVSEATAARWSGRSQSSASSATSPAVSCGPGSAGRSPTSCSTRRTRSSPTWPRASSRSPAPPASRCTCATATATQPVRRTTSTCSLEQRVRGILITPVEQETPQLDVFAAAGMPVVLVDRRRGRAWCSVGVDDVEGGELAVTHLCEQGHQRIAFVGGPMRTVQVADRLEGARRAMAAAGRPTGSLSVIETAGLNVAEGRRAGERLDRPAAGAAAHRRVLRQRSAGARPAPADDGDWASMCPGSWRSSATTTSSSPAPRPCR